MDVYYYRVYGQHASRRRLVVLHDGPAAFLPDNNFGTVDHVGNFPLYGIEYVIETMNFAGEIRNNEVLTQQAAAVYQRRFDQNALNVTWTNPGDPVIASLRAIDPAIPSTQWLQVVSTDSARPSLIFDGQQYSEHYHVRGGPHIDGRV